VEDLEDAPDHEVQAAEEQILDQATAARIIEELKAEISTLQRLEALALSVRRSGEDRKWRELATLLCEIFTPAAIVNCIAETPMPYGSGPIPKPAPSPRQKLVIFTEHRDTLSYTRHKGLDYNTNKALLLQHLTENKDTGCPIVELEQVIPSLSRRAIQRLLGELRSEGKARLAGSKKAARWWIA
jgi:hypothetical protein